MWLAALARQNNGTTVDVARLLHDRLSAVARTGRKRALLPFLPFNRISIPKERLSLWNTDTIRTRKNAPDLIRKRLKRRPSVRAQQRSVESKRFSSRKIDRNRNDAHHVTRPGQWGRCILIHHPVPPANRQFSGINGRICEFLRFWYGN